MISFTKSFLTVVVVAVMTTLLAASSAAAASTVTGSVITEAAVEALRGESPRHRSLRVASVVVNDESAVDESINVNHRRGQETKAPKGGTKSPRASRSSKGPRSSKAPGTSSKAPGASSSKGPRMASSKSPSAETKAPSGKGGRGRRRHRHLKGSEMGTQGPVETKAPKSVTGGGGGDTKAPTTSTGMTKMMKLNTKAPSIAGTKPPMKQMGGRARD